MSTTSAPRPEPGADQELQYLVGQLRSTDVTLRSDAAHALGKLADERAVPALAEALRDQDEYVRKSAVMALRRIGGHGAMEAMRAALADRSEQVCVQAVKGLGELRDGGAVEALIKVLARRERSLCPPPPKRSRASAPTRSRPSWRGSRTGISGAASGRRSGGS